jgi:hypothetical protein
MPLGLAKLEKLINKNNYIIETIYTYETVCRYIKIISASSGDEIVLYIDSQFRLRVSKEEDDRVAIMKLVEFSEGDDTIEKYKEYPGNEQLETKYRKQLELSEDRDVEMSDKLEEKYKYKIFLKDMDKSKVYTVKTFFRQLQRFSLLVQDLRYKMCMFYKNFVFATESNDIINCYTVDSHHVNYRINIVVDLEYFYKKMSVVQEDCETIKLSLYNLVQKNHTECFNNIKQLMLALQSTLGTADFIKTNQLEIDTNLTKSIGLLKTLQTQLDVFIKQYSGLDKTREDVYVHEKKRIEDKIKESEKVKQRLLNYIIGLYEMKDRLTITLDQVEFDISIFLDGIKKRLDDFNSLKKNTQH